MPLFAFIGHDGARGAELRKQHRQEHLANLEPLSAAGRVRHAGPLLDSDGKPVGSVILFEADSLEAALAFAAQDPYVVRGIFERYEVRETRVVFPR
ncbi:MAG: hypothetical protein JSU66_15680 [Deltaproteobacteria bacterium]|nr:MAG: hypothetical protein JSU66_15680 [Deltaproteobacteria bacterium]